jgi:hypothetical protein
VLGERGQHRVTSLPLPLPDRPQVPAVRAAREQVGKDQLRQRQAPQVTGVPRLHQGGQQAWRRHRPAEAHAGGERIEVLPVWAALPGAAGCRARAGGRS